MAKAQKEKKNKGDRNPDRRCGKAWKKHPRKPRKLTKERAIKVALLEMNRKRRYEEDKARRAAEESASKELEEMAAATA